jgi:hypothetical protein
MTLTPSVPREGWKGYAGALVACRHPLLLIVVFVSTWSARADTDWELLRAGGRGLFSSAPLSVYANTPYLQAGPPGLVVMRGLDLLPRSAALAAAHILLAFLGWYMLFLVERWTVPASTWRSAPVGAGLVTLTFGIVVLDKWALLAGTSPHVEDGLAIFTFLLAVRALMTRRDICAALLIGLAAAWKPWAVVALPLLWGCSRKFKLLMIAVAVPAACWLPFLLGDHSTLSAVGHGFPLMSESPLRVLGFSGEVIPDWWRSLQLGAALAGAALVARRDWRAAFAAGCAMRLLLDPAGLGYYDAGLVMVTALTERLIGGRPWRTAVLCLTVAYLPWIPARAVDVVRFVGLAVLYLSWAQPWRRGSGASLVAQPVSLPPL